MSRKIIFFGDSITDAHRSVMNPLGTGYVSMIQNSVNDTLMNQGISGNTSKDLLYRLQRDVLDVDADEVFIMIGINDVWQRYKEKYDGLYLNVEAYRDNLETMIQKIQENSKEITLLMPFYLNTDKEDAMHQRTVLFQEALKEIALKYNLKLIDIQAQMNTYLNDHDASTISDDYVHVNDLGNKIIADTILKHI